MQVHGYRHDTVSGVRPAVAMPRLLCGAACGLASARNRRCADLAPTRRITHTNSTQAPATPITQRCPVNTCVAERPGANGAHRRGSCLWFSCTIR